MSQDQLLDWFAYMRIQPIDPKRDDMRHGLVAAQIANAAGHKNEEGYPLRHSDMIKTPHEAYLYNTPEAEAERQVAMFARATEKMRNALGAAIHGWGK